MHNETYYTKKDCKNIKIAIISDIHYYPNYNLKIFNKIINQIKNNHPNYITIVGDILDSSDIQKLDKLIEFINQLANISPTIIVLGNHDEKKGYINHWSYEKNNQLIESLKQINNVHLLEDTIWTDKSNNISFYGFNLSYHHYEEENESYNSFIKEISKLKSTLNSKNYNITLCHSPINIYTFLKNNKNHPLNKSDLILSGHMHNGAIPFLITYPLNKIFKTTRSLISPRKELFPKYSQGRVYNEITDGYIYEGITKISHSTKILHIFDYLYQKNVEFITIKKED